MYLCDMCNLNFKKECDYNNHINSIEHKNYNESKKNDDGLKNTMLTISSDSLSSLEINHHKIKKVKKSNKTNDEIKKEILKIKVKLDNIMDDLNNLLNEI